MTISYILEDRKKLSFNDTHKKLFLNRFKKIHLINENCLIYIFSPFFYLFY
jgi:hypothetical protein